MTTVYQNTNAYGITTTMKQEGEFLLKQQSFDAEPILESVRQLREAQEGKRWGEGRLVGQIPMAYYQKHIVGIKDSKERTAAVKKFFADHPQFVAYDRYIK